MYATYIKGFLAQGAWWWVSENSRQASSLHGHSSKSFLGRMGVFVVADAVQLWSRGPGGPMI